MPWLIIVLLDTHLEIRILEHQSDQTLHCLKLFHLLHQLPLVKTENEKRSSVMKVQAFCEEKGLIPFLGVLGAS